MTVNAAPTSAILATVWRAFNRLTRSGRTGISLPPHGRKPRGEAAHADRSLQAHEREPTKPSTLTANFRTEGRDAPREGSAEAREGDARVRRGRVSDGFDRLGARVGDRRDRVEDVGGSVVAAAQPLRREERAVGLD